MTARLERRRARLTASGTVTWVAPLVLIAILLGAWQVYVDAAHVTAFVLPSPSEIASSLWTDRSALATGLSVTGKEIVLGILVAAAVACPLTAAIHFSLLARRALYPLLVGSQAIPVVLLAPVLVMWLGFGILPKLIVVGLVCFFPIVVTTLAALESVDPEMLKLLKTFDAGRSQIFRLVELPAALPGLFTGLKLAAVFSVIGAIFAEMSGTSSGLGLLLTTTLANSETAEAFATVFVLSAFAIALFALLTVAQRLLLPWAKSPSR